MQPFVVLTALLGGHFWLLEAAAQPGANAPPSSRPRDFCPAKAVAWIDRGQHLLVVQENSLLQVDVQGRVLSRVEIPGVQISSYEPVVDPISPQRALLLCFAPDARDKGRFVGPFALVAALTQGVPMAHFVSRTPVHATSAWADWSSANDAIVYSASNPGSEGSYSIWQFSPAAKKTVQLTNASGCNDWWPTFTAQARSVIFSRSYNRPAPDGPVDGDGKKCGESRILIVDVGTGRLQVLTRNHADVCPRSSPCGRYVGMIRLSTYGDSLLILHLPSQKLRRLVSVDLWPLWHRWYRWTPPGDGVLFVSMDDLFLAGVDGGIPKQLTANKALRGLTAPPCISPDMSMLAFIRSERLHLTPIHAR